MGRQSVAMRRWFPEQEPGGFLFGSSGSLIERRRLAMQETPQQYTQRILAYLRGEEPMEVLVATPSKIARLIRGVSKKRLARRPALGKWSVTEILAHLADSELVYGFRVRLVLEGKSPSIQNVDQDAWAKFSDYAKHDPLLSLEALRINRKRLLHLLETLPRKSWDFCGIHSERGKESVARLVEMLAGHDINHVNQIKERLLAKGSRKGAS
jgi:DinB superfamily